jgi:DNA-binding GntR family transcriptional regulator
MSSATTAPQPKLDTNQAIRQNPRIPTLVDGIADHVRDLVLTGQLTPGAKIDQEAIAASLGVSRSPVREALVMLGKEGLLQVTPRRGVFVAPLTPEDIVDHYEMFGVLSGWVAAGAARSLSDDDLARLRDIHERFVRNDGVDLSDLNHEFHRVINSTAPPRARWLLGLLARTIPTQYYELVEGWHTEASAHHGAILEALVDRDAERARDIMEQHLRAGGEAAVTCLRSRGFWAAGEPGPTATAGAASSGSASS